MSPLELAIKSVIVSLVGLGAFGLMRRSSAATRHLTLALTLLALCALPVTTLLLPHWQVPFVTVSAEQNAAPLITTDTNRVAANGLGPQASVPPSLALPPTQVSNPAPTSGPTDFVPTAVLVWAVIASLLVLRVGIRLMRLHRLERRLPMCGEPELQSIVADHCRTQGRHLLLLEGDNCEPPMTWGHARPVLLLPSSARDWPADRLRSVLLHEFAHVERSDWIVSVWSELVCAAFWFNPLVWVVKKRLEWESESAADEKVIATGVPRTQYATHLVDLLRDLGSYPKSADAAVAIARPGRLDSRVRSILEDPDRRKTVRGSTTLVLLVLASGLVLLIGSAVPKSVSALGPIPDVQANNAGNAVSTGELNLSAPEVTVTAVPYPESQDGIGDERDDAIEHPTPDAPVDAPASPVVRNDERERDSARWRRWARTGGNRPHGPSDSVSAGDTSSDDQSDDSGEMGAVAESGGEPPADRSWNSEGEANASEDTSEVDRETARSLRQAATQLKQQQQQLRRSLAEADEQMARHGIQLDLHGIIDGALQSARAGLETVKLKRTQLRSMAAEALEGIAKGLKPKPPPVSPDRN